MPRDRPTTRRLVWTAIPRSTGNWFRSVALAAGFCFLAACVSNTRAPIEYKRNDERPRTTQSKASNASRVTAKFHRVVRGDTLHAIAWRYRLDFRDLVRWNNLRNPDLIRVGQKLRLTAPPKAQKQSQSTNTKQAAKKAPSKSSSSTSQAKRATPAKKKSTGAKASLELRWTWPANGESRVAERVSGARGLEIRGKRGQAVKAAAGGTVVYSGSGLRGYGELIIVKHNETFLSAYAHNETRLVEEGRRVKPGQEIARMGNSEAREVMLHFEIRRNGKTVDPLKFLPRR